MIGAGGVSPQTISPLAARQMSRDSASQVSQVQNATRCRTCETRQYQDQSNDPGVSFKGSGHITPSASAALVTSHEREHVSRETARAEEEGQEVVSTNVRVYTASCPECGKVYVAGGQTDVTKRSVTTRNLDEQLLGQLFDAIA